MKQAIISLTVIIFLFHNTLSHHFIEHKIISSNRSVFQCINCFSKEDVIEQTSQASNSFIPSPSSKSMFQRTLHNLINQEIYSSASHHLNDIGSLTRQAIISLHKPYSHHHAINSLHRLSSHKANFISVHRPPFHTARLHFMEQAIISGSRPIFL